MTELRRIDTRRMWNNCKIKSLSINSSELAAFAHQMKRPISVQEVIFNADSTTRSEHFQQLIDAVVRPNNPSMPPVQTLTIAVPDEYEIVEDEQPLDLRLIESLKGLQSSTKHFKLLSRYTQHLPDIFNAIVSVLQSGTNFNEFRFVDLGLFTGPIPLDGFKQFCEYFLENKGRLLSLEVTQFSFSPGAAEWLIQLIQQSPSLTKVQLELTSLYSAEKNIYDILAQSYVKSLSVYYREYLVRPVHYEGIIRLLQKSTKLQELIIDSPESALLVNGYIRQGLLVTECLRKLDLRGDLNGVNFGDLLSAMEQNESVVKYLFYHLGLDSTLVNKIAMIEQRNGQLQIERVRMMVTLLYNMARHHHDNNDTSSSSSSVTSSAWYHLPRDVWLTISSFVTFPGVTSLDFGKELHDQYSTIHQYDV